MLDHTVANYTPFFAINIIAQSYLINDGKKLNGVKLNGVKLKLLNGVKLNGVNPNVVIEDEAGESAPSPFPLVA